MGKDVGWYATWKKCGGKSTNKDNFNKIEKWQGVGGQRDFGVLAPKITGI